MLLPRREVSRIEGFSDAVFGFALTLLVVSLEVPADYRALTATMGAFLPFAVTFTIIVWIWFEHYLFFRKFGPEDGFTIFLNSVLLFVVLFFVYPLKFVFSSIIPMATGIGLSTARVGFQGMSPDDARVLMMIYGGGFGTVFAVFALLHWNAYRQRAALGLDRLSTYNALAGMRTHSITVIVASASIALAATLPSQLVFVSGVMYFILGPIHAVNGYLIGRAREKLSGG